MNKTRIGYALAVIALIAVLGFLIAKTRAVNFDANARVVATLRDLKQLDAEWNVDVLRSKTGLNNSYDPVASPLPLIDSLDSQLQNTTQAFFGTGSGDSERLEALLAAHKTAMDKKIALIEQFKSQNAILRNSSRFLPVAATDLIETVRAEPATSGTAQIEQSLNRVLTDAMSYALTPEEDLKARIEAGAQALQQQVEPMPEAVRERANTLVAHVNTILKQQQIGDGLLGELAVLPVASTIDALAEGYAQAHDQRLQTQQKYAQALMVYSVLLLLLLGYIGWRLFKSYRLLNSTHSALQKSNAELKESQVYMVQSEKMSALGQMVAGIAHEINTPLAYVKGTIDVLAEQLMPVKKLALRCQQFTESMRIPAGERDNTATKGQLLEVEELSNDLIKEGVLTDVETMLKDGVHGIEQISEIVLNLKNFSRLDRARVSEFGVQDGLESTLLLARNMLKNSVEIRKEFQAVPKIQCSPSQINQVFLNLISNAAQAMEGRAEKGLITLRTLPEGEDMVRVEVQDNGSGIPADVLPRIFDPFFTTKDIGKGTGMGLSISFKIIEQHGGKILVDSEPGSGTVFSILLPVRAKVEAAVLMDDQLEMA